MGYRVFFSLVAALMAGGSLLPRDDGTITLPPDGSGDYQHDVGYRF